MRTMKISWIVVLGLMVCTLAMAQEAVVSRSASPCLNLRTAPEPGTAVVACLVPGTRVMVSGRAQDWARAGTADGRSGWLASHYLDFGSRAGEAASALVVEAPMSRVRPLRLGGPLYDQTDSPAGAGFSSQTFAPVDAAFDCRAADDFVIPVVDGGWNIREVVVAGAYVGGAGPTPLVDVEFFADGGGLPAAAPSCSYLGLVAGVDFVDDGLGNLAITLPADCSLSSGDYWVSVRAEMDQAVGGQWLWGERTAQTGNPFAWENPGDGFGTGCVSWDAGTNCGAAAPDLLFALEGAPVPVDLQSFDIE